MGFNGPGGALGVIGVVEGMEGRLGEYATGQTPPHRSSDRLALHSRTHGPAHVSSALNRHRQSLEDPNANQQAQQESPKTRKLTSFNMIDGGAEVSGVSV